MSRLIEEWRPVIGYEGLYEVSDWGRVKSLNYNHTGREKLLIPAASSNGYLFVKLYKKGKVKQPKVHQLVAQAFIPNPNGYTEVNHKDENKTNNTVWVNDDGTVDLEKSNLEWCNRTYNNNYGTRNQRTTEARNKKVYQYTLDGRLVKIWSSTAEAGKNGFNRRHIFECCNGKRKQHKGFRWSYTPL